MYIFSGIIVFVLMFFIAITYEDIWFGKVMYRKIDKINSACVHSADANYFIFDSHKESFTVKIADEEVPKGLRHAQPNYNCKNIFINDELVLKLHCIETKSFKTYRVVEYSATRHEEEINSLIKDAYHAAKVYMKKINNDRYKAIYEEKSFFN